MTAERAPYPTVPGTGRGVPASLGPLSGIGPLTNQATKVLLTDRGQRLVVGNGNTVTFYRLRHHLAGTEAVSEGGCRLDGTVSAMCKVSAERVAVAVATERETAIQLLGSESNVDLVRLNGRVNWLAPAGQRLIAATEPSDRPAEFVAVNVISGRIVSRRSLEDGAFSLQSDQREGSFTAADPVRRMVMRLTEQEDQEYRSGDSWVADECIEWVVRGDAVVRRNRCRPEEADGKQRLDFPVARLHRAGRLLAATDARAHRLALLDPHTLRVLHVRGFGRDGAVLAMAADTPLAAVFDRRTARWAVLDLDRILDEPPALARGAVAPAEASMTFFGRDLEEDLRPVGVPQLGRKRVLALPVIEPGQSFTDPDVGKFAAFMRTNAFDEVHDYYDEASFGQLDLAIEVLGDDVGPAGRPLEMPQSFREYFWKPFVAGGLTAIHTAPATPYEVAIDGTESLRLHIVPRERDEDDDLVVPFCALGLS
jgi:hypothetical protein